MNGSKIRKSSSLFAILLTSLLVFLPTKASAIPKFDAVEHQKPSYLFPRTTSGTSQQCFGITGQPLRTELGTQTDESCFPYVLDKQFTNVELSFVELAGVEEDEKVVGTRQITYGYCQYFSSGRGSQICAEWRKSIVSQRYPDGSYAMRYQATDASGKDLVSVITFQIANGLPSVALGGVRTPKIASSNAKATAIITFQDIRATDARVELRQAKNKPTVVKVDLTDSINGSGSAEFGGLKPSTEYRYQIVTKNANGNSEPVSGTFTTPDPPKSTSGSRTSGGSSSGAPGSCPYVVGVRLDRAESALRRVGCWPSSYESSGCEALFGIVKKSNWVVVAQRGSELYACQG